MGGYGTLYTSKTWPLDERRPSHVQTPQSPIVWCTPPSIASGSGPRPREEQGCTVRGSATLPQV